MLNLESIDVSQPYGMTMSEIKEHCYVTGDDFDEILLLMYNVAREYAEARTWRQIAPASYVLYLDSFPEVIELPKPPTISVTSVKYYDTDDSIQTLSASLYQVDIKSEYARIKPVDGESWPDTYNRMNAIEIAFTAGYDESSESLTLPYKIKQAILMFVKHLFDNRSAVEISEGRTIDTKEVPYTTNYLLDSESARIFV